MTIDKMENKIEQGGKGRENKKLRREEKRRGEWNNKKMRLLEKKKEFKTRR